jgi:hypothetical protein
MNVFHIKIDVIFFLMIDLISNSYFHVLGSRGWSSNSFNPRFLGLLSQLWRQYTVSVVNVLERVRSDFPVWVMKIQQHQLLLLLILPFRNIHCWVYHSRCNDLYLCICISTLNNHIWHMINGRRERTDLSICAEGQVESLPQSLIALYDLQVCSNLWLCEWRMNFFW